MMKTSRILLSALILSAFAGATAAQQTVRGPLRIGHIVAVVGDSAITNFTVDEALLARATQRGLSALPQGAELAQWREAVLEERIDELLLLQAALRDTSIHVPEDQLAQAVRQDIEERTQSAGGPAAFERALRASGLTPQTYRDLLLEQQRRQYLIQQYLEKARRGRKPPPVTEQEMREQFEASKEGFPQRPATVSHHPIMVRTEPTEAALEAARVKTDSVLKLALAKEDFAELARRFSEDPGSREAGGDLGYQRRGNMYREFEAVAFNLLPGHIGVAKTDLGFHIIKAERVRQSEVQFRHILIRPALTAADAERARARADTVAERLREGADPTELARQYGDRDESVRAPPHEYTQTQQRYGVDLSTATAGQIVGPVPVGGGDVAESFVVLKVLSREDARPWTFEDREIRDRLRETLQTQKLFAEIVDELRRSSYVDIRGT